MRIEIERDNDDMDLNTWIIMDSYSTYHKLSSKSETIDFIKGKAPSHITLGYMHQTYSETKLTFKGRIIMEIGILLIEKLDDVLYVQ